MPWFSIWCRNQPLIWCPKQSTQEWSPKVRDRDGVVRVDLLSAHVLSEFVVDMSPATNAAAAEAASAAAAGKHRCRAEERKPQMLHLRTRPPPP